MASNTSHYNLVKPAYDEAADVAVINGNMDTIDGQMYNNEQGVNDLQNGLAIVANGNTHVSITAGQYVFVKNHGTLANGLYVATSNIAANATLSSSNLTLETSGGLNALNSKLNVIGNRLFGSNNTTSLNVSTDTIKLVNSVTLTAGMWLVIFSADWSSNPNGYRQISDQNLTDPGRYRCVNNQAVTKEMYQQFTEFIVTNGQTVDMYALQNSGSSINMFPYIVAIQIA